MTQFSLNRISELAAEILAINKANGWEVTTPDLWADETRPFKLRAVGALIISEISEALEAYRKADKENFAEELADTVIRILDLLQGLGFGLDFAQARFNESYERFRECKSYDDTYGAAFALDEHTRRILEKAGFPQQEDASQATIHHGYDVYALPAILNDIVIVTSLLGTPDTTVQKASEHYVNSWLGVIKTLNTISLTLLGDTLDAAISAKLEKNRSRGFKHGGKLV
jgi:NTP pyrophosphatase (non-canonical NTP hydrolase)